MSIMDCRAEMMNALQDAVVEFDQRLVREIARRAVSAGVDAREAIVNGLAIGMDRVGELYARGEYFLPEVTMCADAFYEGLAILRPHVKQNAGWQEKVTVVIGTVEGDEHDIGKNLVKLMLEVAGCTVYDLGVRIQHIVETIEPISAQPVYSAHRRKAHQLCNRANCSGTGTTASGSGKSSCLSWRHSASARGWCRSVRR